MRALFLSILVILSSQVVFAESAQIRMDKRNQRELICSMVDRIDAGYVQVMETQRVEKLKSALADFFTMLIPLLRKGDAEKLIPELQICGSDFVAFPSSFRSNPKGVTFLGPDFETMPADANLFAHADYDRTGFFFVAIGLGVTTGTIYSLLKTGLSTGVSEVALGGGGMVSAVVVFGLVIGTQAGIAIHALDKVGGHVLTDGISRFVTTPIASFLTGADKVEREADRRQAEFLADQAAQDVLQYYLRLLEVL